MKRILFLIASVILTFHLYAQVHVNPQFGSTILTLKNLSTGERSNGKIGVTMGADFRIGDAIQFIPGIHVTSVVGTYENETAQITNKIGMDGFKLKSLVGMSVINNELFKLRIVIGPTYDFSTYNNHTSFISDFKNGDVFIQGGIGVDLAFITLDAGFTRAMTDRQNTHPNDKLKGVYASVGLIL